MPKVIGNTNEICYLRAGGYAFPMKVLGRGIFVKGKLKAIN